MLSVEHRAIVKATVPLLESGGEALTTHFYAKLLNDYPEVRPFFNQAHQASGAQPRALANGVLMYARHIDELDQLGDLVARIINKHVALNIDAAHYPLVGQCLLASIREVLGAEIATDAVLDAWAAAYGQLAQLLIGLEQQRYDEKANATGGWRGTRAFTVTRKVAESDEITSFYLQPVDGLAVLSFEPGQYTGLCLTIDGEDVRRNYSLSAPSNGREYRISVKREPNGKVSNYLHDRVHEGDVLDVLPPAGEFTLHDSDKPLVLISAGVGITPMMPMLHSALATKRPIVFIHAARHSGVQAFRLTIDDLAATHPQLTACYCYEQPRQDDLTGSATGRIDRAMLEAWLAANRDVDAYILGPLPFMKAMKQHLQAIGVAASQCRYEFFGPAAALD